MRLNMLGTFKENLTERFKDDYITSSRMPNEWKRFSGGEKFVFEIDPNSLNITGCMKEKVGSEIRLNIKETLTQRTKNSKIENDNKLPEWMTSRSHLFQENREGFRKNSKLNS